MLKSSRHRLNFDYQQYRKMGESIAHTRIDKYVVYDILGRGAFGAVYQGMDDITKKKVAIKVLDLYKVQKQPNQYKRNILKRLCRTQSILMMKCNSDNVIKCYDVYQNDSLKVMVMQFCNGGDLNDQIKSKKMFPQKEAILILKQIINGIAELHKNKIIHRDLKAENILSHNGVYKIADLGFSKEIIIDQQVQQTTLGTITTMAPQVMMKRPYGLKADIWSIGVIFYQMLFGKVPYKSVQAKLLYAQIQSKVLFPGNLTIINGVTLSKQVIQFLKGILVIDTSQRMGWKQLLEHPLFIQKQNNSQKLGNQFRLTLTMSAKIAQLEDIQRQAGYEHVVPQVSKQFQQSVVTKIINQLNQQQLKFKKKQMQNIQDNTFMWTKLTYHQCLITQLIYDEIISPIQQYQLLDFEKRQVVELMYLLFTRCHNNMSVIKNKLQNDKELQKNNQCVFLIRSLQGTVKPFFQKIRNKWNTYAQRLTQMQNRFSSIVGDRLSKIFKSQSMKQKDKFLVGNQIVDYSKEQQINFTDTNYIEEVLDKLKSPSSVISMKARDHLRKYKELNYIKYNDLHDRPFQLYVNMILQ